MPVYTLHVLLFQVSLFWKSLARLAGLRWSFELESCVSSEISSKVSMVRHRTSNCRPLAYDSAVMDAKHILERVAVLKHEMEDLQVVNVGPDEPRLSKGVYEARLSRLEQIKMELAALLDQFKRTGTKYP